VQNASFIVNEIILGLLSDIVVLASDIIAHGLDNDNVINPILALSESVILKLVLLFL
jgi:hypothetical protein